MFTRTDHHGVELAGVVENLAKIDFLASLGVTLSGTAQIVFVHVTERDNVFRFDIAEIRPTATT